MKLLKLMSGNEIVISDEEAEKISQVVETSKFIKLRNGDFVNVSSISCIVNYKGIPMVENHSGAKRLYISSNGSFYYNYDNQGFTLKMVI